MPELDLRGDDVEEPLALTTAETDGDTLREEDIEGEWEPEVDRREDGLSVGEPLTDTDALFVLEWVAEAVEDIETLLVAEIELVIRVVVLAHDVTLAVPPADIVGLCEYDGDTENECVPVLEPHVDAVGDSVTV